MADTGAISPGTMADDATVGTVAWTNPDNAKVSDSVYATAVVANTEITHYLKATNFGFVIPTGATINGILVEVEKKDTFGNSVVSADNAVRIIKGGVIGSTDKSSLDHWLFAEAYKSYGSSTDLWGETWTASDINDATFGFAISAKGINASFSGSLKVDHIRITVYYTVPVTYTMDCLPANYVFTGMNIAIKAPIQWATQSKNNATFTKQSKN